MSPASAATTTCPAARLADEQRGLLYTHDILDRLMLDSKDPDIAAKFGREMDVVWAKISATEESASWVRATSVPGAIFQATLLVSGLDSVGNDQRTDGELKRDAERLKRLAYSVLGALGADAADRVVEMYAPPRFDEVAKLDRIVAQAVH